MTEAQFTDAKKAYLENIKKYMIEAGGLFPHISVFADHKNEDKKNETAIIHVPIPDKFMKSDSAKDLFVDQILPEIAKKINQEFIVKAVGWASEAWMRHMDQDQVKDGHVPSNWRDLPKKEVLIVTMESENVNEVSIYDMIREGLKVNEEGEMIDSLELIEQEGFGNSSQAGDGRFTGLYKKFLQFAEES